MFKNTVLILVFTFSATGFLFAQSRSLEKADSNQLLKIVGFSLSPFVPPTVLLGVPREFKNKDNVRSRGLSGSASLVQSRGESNIGLNLAYTLTTSRDYWVLGLGSLSFKNSEEALERVDSVSLEYRLFPYKKLRLSNLLSIEKWSADNGLSVVEEFGLSMKFPVTYRLNKKVSLSYAPGIRYREKIKDVSGEISIGANTRFIQGLGLNASLLYLFGRKASSNESIASVNFGLSI